LDLIKNGDASANAAPASAINVTKKTKQQDNSRLICVEAANLIAKRHIYMIALAFSLPALSAESAVGSTSSSQPFEWLERNAELLRTSAKKAKTRNPEDSEFEASVAAWCSVVNELLSSFQRLIDGRNEGPLVEELKKALGIGASGAEFAACCESGSDLLLRIIEILLALGSSAEVEAIFRDVVASSHCMKDTRGLWAARYTRFVATLRMSCTDTGASQLSPLRDAVAYVEGQLASRPDLMVNAAMEPFYDAVLSLELLRARLPVAPEAPAVSPAAALAFARGVAESAVRVCPYVRSFWERFEEIERLRGDYKSANHIRWKKDSMTKQEI
jgi:hypothetical protein